jgi:hypothetical protein
VSCRQGEASEPLKRSLPFFRSFLVCVFLFFRSCHSSRLHSVPNRTFCHRLQSRAFNASFPRLLFPAACARLVWVAEIRTRCRRKRPIAFYQSTDSVFDRISNNNRSTTCYPYYPFPATDSDSASMTRMDCVCDSGAFVLTRGRSQRQMDTVARPPTLLGLRRLPRLSSSCFRTARASSPHLID